MSDTALPPGRTERLLALLQKALGHELPNQLVAMQGLARLLEIDQAEHLDEEGKDYLRRLAMAAQRTHELVILLAELIRADRNDPGPGTASLAAAAQEARIPMKSLYPGLAVEYHGPERDVLLPMSAAKLRQVLVALCRAMAAKVPPGTGLRIEVSGREVAEQVEFSVSDNGPGLTAPDRQRLFEPFEASPGRGHNLDLFLVRHVVEGLGGTVRVDSTESGTTYTMVLPRKR